MPRSWLVSRSVSPLSTIDTFCYDPNLGTFLIRSQQTSATLALIRKSVLPDVCHLDKVPLITISCSLGAFCESPGQPWDGQACDFATSTWYVSPLVAFNSSLRIIFTPLISLSGNATEDCHGRGPAFTHDAFGFGSNVIIGTNQFTAAKTLMSATNLSAISGAVRGLHTYVNMTNYAFALPNGTSVTTCPAAMGYSFAGQWEVLEDIIRPGGD